MTLDGSGATTVGVPNSGTAQNSTSGTSIDFTGILAGTKRITVMFNNVSTNGSSLPQVQIGSGSVVTSGYVSYATITGTGTTGSALTSGIGLAPSGQWGAAAIIYGVLSLCLQNASTNTWVASGTLGGQNSVSSAANFLSSGYLALSGTLDRVRITTVNGTDTFDAGSINILYE